MYLELIITAVLAYLLGQWRDFAKQIFNKKLEIYSKIVHEINSVGYLKVNNSHEGRQRMIELFAPARLLGGKYVVEELREYFSLVTEYYDADSEKKEKEIGDKISVCTMELEQLMRRDLGKCRLISKLEIRTHHNNQ